MTVTALSVINIFTDEFDQVKAEGKYCFFSSSYRCKPSFQLSVGYAVDEARWNLDAYLCAWLHWRLHASCLHKLQTLKPWHSSGLHRPFYAVFRRVLEIRRLGIRFPISTSKQVLRRCKQTKSSRGSRPVLYSNDRSKRYEGSTMRNHKKQPSWPVH